MILTVFYLVVAVGYIACFVAFMNSKRKDKKYWKVYDGGAGATWVFEYQIGMVFSALLWPISIPGYIFYKLVYKQAEKFFNKEAK
jgi:hypothetical protein